MNGWYGETVEIAKSASRLDGLGQSALSMQYAAGFAATAQ